MLTHERVGDNFNTAVLLNSNTRVRSSEVDADDGAHLLLGLLGADEVASGEEADNGEEDKGAQGDFGHDGRGGGSLPLGGARPYACAWVCHGGGEGVWVGVSCGKEKKKVDGRRDEWGVKSI